jgi:hypothetical protein
MLGWQKFNENNNIVYYTNGFKCIKLNKNRELNKLVVSSIVIEAERLNRQTTWTKPKKNTKSLFTEPLNVVNFGTTSIWQTLILLATLALVAIILYM